ncbi:MAG: hypothetical protein U0414_19285 [Polyangiaceae bacterium]
MFRIRRQQLDWFADKARRDYVERISTWLEQAYPECVGEMERGDLVDWVARTVAKCERYGVVMEEDVTQALLLFMVLGEDADEARPWVKQTLLDRDLLPGGRVRKLVELAMGEGIEGIEHVVILKESA